MSTGKVRDRNYVYVYKTLILGGVAASLVVHAETYYFAGSSHNAPGFSDPTQWTNATGVVATEFSMDDTYAIGSSTTRQLDKPRGDVVFSGGVMQLGSSAAGTLNMYSGGVYFPLLKLGPGEGVVLSYDTANTTNRISGRMTVENSPTTVRWAAAGETADRSGQVQYYDVTLVGNSSAKIQTDIRYPQLSKNETLALAGDCSGFFGTISLTRYRSTALVASWPDYWARLDLARENFDMPASVEINTGCVLESSANTAILRALKLYASGRLKIHSFPQGSGLVVTNAVTLNTASAGADILEVVAERRVGHLSTNAYPVFTVPLASNVPWERFSIIEGYGRPLPVPDSSFAVTTNSAAGTETLSLVEPPVVTFVASDTYAKETDPSGGDSASALDKAASWSDSATPHSGTHYLLEALDGADSSHHTTFRTRNTYTEQTFEGDSLTLGDICTLFVFASKFSLPRLRLLNGSHLCSGGTVSNGKTAEIDAPVEVPANCVAYVGPYSAGRLALTDSVSGRGTISLVGSIISTSYLQGFLRLDGDNAGFLGRISIRQYFSRSATSINEGQYLEFSAENNLGGALPTFDAEALSVGRCSALTPLTNVTLNASSNRGLYITDSGAVNVTNANTTLTLNWPLKVKGTMEKWGPGTLALGGPLTLDGSCRMEVRQGAVQPLAQDALNGLTLSFAAGGSLLFDLSALPSGGMRNLAATPFELGDGVTTLPIEVKGDRTRSLAHAVSVPLLTVAQSAKAAVLGILPTAPHPYLNCKVRWTFEDDLVADTFTVGLSLRPIGMTINIK